MMITAMHLTETTQNQHPQDYKVFLDFVLAMENRSAAPALKVRPSVCA